MSLPILDNIKYVLLTFVILVLTFYVLYLKTKNDNLESSNLELKYKNLALEKDVSKYMIKNAELLEQNSIQKKVNKELLKEIKSRDEKILALININENISIALNLKESKLVKATDSIEALKKLIYNSSSKDSISEKDSSKILAYNIEHKKDDVSIKGNFVLVYKKNDVVTRPVKAFSIIDNISLKPKLTLVQSFRKKDGLVRFYAKSLSEYMMIDSSKYYLDFDYAKFVAEEYGDCIDKNKLKLVLGVGIYSENFNFKDYRTKTYGLNINAGFSISSYDFYLQAFSNRTIGINLNRRFEFY